MRPARICLYIAASVSMSSSVVANWEHSVEGHAPPPARSPEAIRDAGSRSAIPSGAVNDASKRLIRQQQSTLSHILDAEQWVEGPHALAAQRHDAPMHDHTAAHQQKSAGDSASVQNPHVSLEHAIPQQKEAMIKAALERCRLMENMMLQQRETIAQHESTIASLERDLADFCAHAHSTIQESEEAAQQAMNEAKAYREQAAAATAREQAAEAALAAATHRLSADAVAPIDVMAVSEAEARARELAENAQQLQKQLEEQHDDHQQQLQRLCETYESRINKLSEGGFFRILLLNIYVVR
jgi:hypothetical protein